MAGIGYATLSVLPSAKGFGSKLSSQIDPEMDAAGRAGGKTFGSGMLGAAKAFAGPLIAAFTVGAGVALFKGAIDGASDLNESASKVGVVFGKQSDQILAASETSATAMGLSKSAYLAANGTLGNLLVSLKVAPKAAADMSQQMVALAGDMASFNNVSPEEALAAIQSGLTGETEPLKRFGVNMNDATLKAQALKMGLIASTKDAMTPQTKALAAQGLIMAQTGTAQGDFARTSDGLANQQRILAARTEDLKTKLGTALLPAVTSATTAVSNFIGGMKDGTGAGGTFRDILDKIGGALQAVGGFLKDHTTLIKAAAVVIGVLTVAVQAHNLAMAIQSGALATWIAQTTVVKVATAAWSAIQWVLNAALTANPIGIVIVAVAALVAVIVLIATKTTWFQTIWKVMTDALATAWQWLWNTILAPIIRFVLNGFASITDGIAKMLNVLSNIPGFGWAKVAADKMSGAADKARALADGIKDIPDNKTVTITMLAIERASSIASGGRGHTVGGNAMGTDYWRGGPTWVGERGPEIVNLPRGSQVIPNHKISAGAGVGIDYDRLASAMSRVQIGLDGRNVARSVDQRLAPR